MCTKKESHLAGQKVTGFLKRIKRIEIGLIQDYPVTAAVCIYDAQFKDITLKVAMDVCDENAIAR